MTSFQLRYDEAAYLAGYLRRLQSWTPDAAVRLKAVGGTLGAFSAPPFDCVALVVVPLVEPVAEPYDEVVSAGRLRDIIGDVSSGSPRGVRAVTTPDPVGPVADLAVLPPAGPWLPAERGLAGDVRPLVEAAVTDYRSRASALGNPTPSMHEALAEEVWSRPGWGGVPLRALHGAATLGLMPHDGLRVETGTCDGWKRLLTPGGQVFVRTAGLPARLSLAVLRTG